MKMTNNANLLTALESKANSWRCFKTYIDSNCKLLVKCQRILQASKHWPRQQRQMTFKRKHPPPRQAGSFPPQTSLLESLEECISIHTKYKEGERPRTLLYNADMMTHGKFISVLVFEFADIPGPNFFTWGRCPLWNIKIPLWDVKIRQRRGFNQRWLKSL